MTLIHYAFIILIMCTIIKYTFKNIICMNEWTVVFSH